ncbi:glycosyltransferase family 9 protein [Flavobacterium sp. SE-s28]|uniref:Glycosyltransferase family 9 protein n=2 Tax=Flavobacterium silvaticum TaxID=1852020 RepID=A0A972FVH6_9FLAO|nr:glycosyltransferase family 9 protein [Flavobacterium silvaticum]
MGDVAMTVPVLRALVKQHPMLKVTVVSRGFFKPFFADIPNVDFFAVDLKQRHKGTFGLFRLYGDIKKRGVNGIADLHNVLRSKVVRTLFSLSGFPVAFIDKGREEKKALTRATDKIFKQLKSTFERYADVFSGLGFPIDLSGPHFSQKPELSAETVSIVGTKTGNWIGIAPFAQHSGKVYPMDSMAEVIDKLSSDPNNKVFLFGAGDPETKQLDAFASGKNNVINLSGKLGLAKELELISRLEVMLSMDSGNAHLAAMFGVPVVTIWGATHPFTGFNPYRQPIENALTADRETYPLLPTSVYGNKVVAGYEDAMRSISVESIVKKVASLL